MPHSPIREAALAQKRVDTHAHLQAAHVPLEELAAEPDALDGMERAAARRTMAAGCEALYGVPVGPVLTTEAPRDLFERAAELRARGRQAAFARAFELARIETQLCFCDWRGSDAAEKRAIAPHVRLLAYIDQALLGTPEPGEGYLTGLERLHGRLASLGDLLEIVDRAVAAWPAMGVVGMKVSLAYHGHGLALRDPSPAEAEAAFARGHGMSAEDAARVRDFALFRAFDACLRSGLPIVFHTGFLAFGEALIAGANPALLQPVLQDARWREATFVLLHGGYPYTGETAYLASRIPNVLLDFTWLPFLSPARFRSALAEWLELVPLTRFLWGSDSSAQPESIVGIDRITRHLIAGVLEDALDEGLMDAGRALRFVELAFRENARRIFRLAER